MPCLSHPDGARRRRDPAGIRRIDPARDFIHRLDHHSDDALRLWSLARTGAVALMEKTLRLSLSH